MTATPSTQTAQTSAKAPVQIGRGKEEANTNGFANLLADTIASVEAGEKGVKSGKALKGGKAPSSAMLDIAPHEKSKKAGKVPSSAMLDIASDEKSVKSGKTPSSGIHDVNPDNKSEKSGKVSATPMHAKKSSAQVLGEIPKEKGKQILSELDMSALDEGELEEVEAKKAMKLSDILTKLSHESVAPVGSEVINLKTVLSSKNDDPDLINKDLLALVAKEDREKVMGSLIQGAKQLLTDQLEQRISKDRVPKTLKGLLETAIRFNLVVSDIKLESLPQNKVIKDLLQALEVQTKQEIPLPSLSTKKLGNEKISKALKGAAKTEKASPLEQVLNPKEIGEDTKIAQEPLKKALDSTLVQTQSVKQAPVMKERERERTKTDAKEEIKVARKETLASELGKASPVTQNSQAAPKNANLEKLLSTELTQEQTATESKVASESSQPQHLSKNELAPLKAESNLGVKMFEARQLVSQLSQDVKEAMENYKPPFTKLSMKLNPERLGEIDVMMVQRGNNVHINLTSNGQALGLLQQNSGDLKVALANAGLGDATMNFSSNGESRNQQEQQKHSTSERYAEMSKLMEDIESLEIVVPRYV